MSAEILITGGAGYLGSVLTGKLLESGYRVTVIDNLYYQIPSLLSWCSHANFKFVEGDARDKELLSLHLKKADAIIPLAAMVGMDVCNKDPQMAESTNFEAIRMLNTIRSPKQLVISPCTNSGYGTKTGDVYCTEDTPMEPVSHYGRTKVQAEALLLSSANTISLRLATVFGTSPRMRFDLLVNNFVLNALTQKSLIIYEKDFKRNYVHIRDVADCFCFCLENSEHLKGEAYNLGLDEANYSKEELAEKIKEYIPDLYIHYAEVGSDPDKRNYIVSNEKLRKKGFEAKRSVDSGIRELMMAVSMIPRHPMKNI